MNRLLSNLISRIFTIPFIMLLLFVSAKLLLRCAESEHRVGIFVRECGGCLLMVGKFMVIIFIFLVNLCFAMANVETLFAEDILKVRVFSDICRGNENELFNELE